MSFMSALDIDSQEMIDAVDKVSGSYVDLLVQGAEAGQDIEEIEHAYRHQMMDALIAQGWVPPTLAALANKRIRSVIDFEAPVTATLVAASELLVPPADAGAELAAA